MFGLSRGVLVLVGEGETQQELLGLSGGIFWERGDERRLYARALSERERLWGEREDAVARAAKAGLEARDLSLFESDFAVALSEVVEVQTPFGESFVDDVLAAVRRDKRFRREGVAVRDLRHRFGEMKLRKSHEEIEDARTAGRKSGEAHRALLSESWVGRREKDLALAFDLELRRRGIGQAAYDSIVGSGERALVLHARAGDRVIQEGELILVDAAGRWGEMRADITRTFPAGRSFSVAQRTLYEIVLKAQKEAIAFARPGVTLEDLHRGVRSSLAEGLRREGWLARPELLDVFYPHQTSHWLGKQVHDRCPYDENDGSPIRLEEGMIFTIEPGLYMRGEEAPADIRGAGLRIEDDVLVTSHGVEVLTSAAPKEVADIESLRARMRSDFVWID